METSYDRAAQREASWLEKAKRDDRTVVVANLDIQAREHDIREFFEKKGCEVNNCRLVTDPRNGRSKGIAYVEFTKTSYVIPAVKCTGSLILGIPIQVKASEAERNRAAKSAKLQKNYLATSGPRKIYLSGFKDVLLEMSSSDILHFVSPMGTVVNVELPLNQQNSKNLGYCYVEFDTPAAAATAAAVLNRIVIHDCVLSCVLVANAVVDYHAEGITNARAVLSHSLIKLPELKPDDVRSEVVYISCVPADEIDHVVKIAATKGMVITKKLLPDRLFIRYSDWQSASRFMSSFPTDFPALANHEIGIIDHASFLEV